MKVTLISPPFLDPRAPYLAVPSLTAYLRLRGHQVTQTDLNVRALSSLLSSTHLTKLFRRDWPPSARICMENVDQAVCNLRDSTAFLNFETYCHSRNVLDITLRVISTHYPGADLNLRRIASASGTLKQIVTSILQGQQTPFDSLYIEKFVPEIIAGDPDLVGISVSNGSQLLPALRLARLVKAGGALTILGGPVITQAREKILRTSEFFEIADGAVIYEGEEALERLIDNLETGKHPFSGIPNCLFRDGSQVIIRNEPFALNLNSLPTPDFEGLPLESYFAPHPVLPLLSAKGCAWGLCTFCTIPDTSSSAGIRSRERPTSKVVADLSALRKTFNARHFIFVDEDISANRLERLGKAIIEAKLDIVWLAYSRFEKGHTPQRCRTYYGSGCRKLLMGLESASSRILRLMKKGITSKTVHDNLMALDKAKISVHIFCMLGFPSETLQEMEGTLNFLRDRRHLLFKKGFSASFSEFVLGEESDIDRQPEKFGVLKGERSNDWQFAGDSADGYTPSMAELPELRRRFNASLRDIFYPNEMIGWEEYTLLYEDSTGECRFPWRRPTHEVVSLVRGDRAGSLVLRSRSFRFVEALLPDHSRRKAEAKDFWLINMDSGYVLTVGRHVQSLFDEIDGRAELDTVIGRFASHVGREPSAVREICLELVEELLKHGFLAEAIEPESTYRSVGT